MIDANLRYETKAEAFHIHTAMLAPGKDQCDDANTEEERTEAWAKFQSEYHKAFTLFFYAADRVLFEEDDHRMTAAHDLLEALRAIEAQAHDSSVNPLTRFISIQSIARAAIAKAEGVK